MNSFKQFIDFFLPRFCPSCNTKLCLEENIVCGFCFSKIERADEKRIALEFERKFSEEKIISGFFLLWIFEKEKELQHIIHQLKYNGKFRIGIFLGEMLGKELQNKIGEWEIDCLVPVPLHNLKRAERGFNQSVFIAKGVKTTSNIPVKSRLLKRRRFTETQTNLTLAERKENVKEAFVLRRNNNIEGKKILLLDDVITTGATIAECGRILLNNGAEKIFAASVAIAN